MKFERTITIRSTPEEIWNTLTNFEQAQKWNECLIQSEQISEGQIRKGFRSKTLIKEGKKNVWYEEEIVDFSPYTKLKLKLSGKNLGKNPMNSAYRLEETEQGTTITQAIEWQPSGILLKLLHGMITKMSEKNIENDLSKLKTYLEHE